MLSRDQKYGLGRMGKVSRGQEWIKIMYSGMYRNAIMKSIIVYTNFKINIIVLKNKVV